MLSGIERMAEHGSRSVRFPSLTRTVLPLTLRLELFNQKQTGNMRLLPWVTLFDCLPLKNLLGSRRQPASNESHKLSRAGVLRGSRLAGFFLMPQELCARKSLHTHCFFFSSFFLFLLFFLRCIFLVAQVMAAMSGTGVWVLGPMRAGELSVVASPGGSRAARRAPGTPALLDRRSWGMEGCDSFWRSTTKS